MPYMLWIKLKTLSIHCAQVLGGKRTFDYSKRTGDGKYQICTGIHNFIRENKTGSFIGNREEEILLSNSVSSCASTFSLRYNSI